MDPMPARQAFALGLGARLVGAADLAARCPIVIEPSGQGAARQLALDKVVTLGAAVQRGGADRWLVDETKSIRRTDFFYIRSFYFPEFEANHSIFRAERANLARFIDERGEVAAMPDSFKRFSQGLNIKPAVSFAII